MNFDKKKLSVCFFSYSKNDFLINITLKSFLDKTGSYFNVFWFTTGEESSFEIKDNYFLIRVQKSCWKIEFLNQVSYLNSLGVNNFLFLLDDFLFIKKNNAYDVIRLYNLFVKNKLYYLKLKKDPFSFFNLFYFKIIFKNFYAISRKHPYYSSLQAAFWQTSYLIKKIKLSSNIWDFESIVSTEKHYQTSTILFYKHIIEKGEIIYENIKNYENDINLLSLNLKIKKTPFHIRIKQKIKFLIFGYIKHIYFEKYNFK